MQFSAVALWAKREINARNAMGKEGVIKAVIIHCLISYIYTNHPFFKLEEPAVKALENYVGKRKLTASSPEKDPTASPSKRKKKEDRTEEGQSNSNI